jgi:hypothetical protein
VRLAKIEDWIEGILRYNSEINRLLRFYEDYFYERYSDTYEIVLEAFKAKMVEYVISVMQEVVNELEIKGVDIDRLNRLRYWKRIIENAILDFMNMAKYPNKLELPIERFFIIYGDTMGFVKEGDKDWDVLEGSDEPTELDLYLYQKLVSGEEKRTIDLYGMHNRDFVMSWKENGIDENVYFAEDRWVAERYWHAQDDDVLVKVEAPLDAVIQTAEGEWKTIRRIQPGEFRLKILG